MKQVTIENIDKIKIGGTDFLHGVTLAWIADTVKRINKINEPVVRVSYRILGGGIEIMRVS